jgi:transposase
MKRFIEGEDRTQVTLLPDCLDDYIAEDNLVRAVDAFVEELDLKALGFAADPATTGRPGYYPTVLLKLYIYGYLNRVPSSRRLEREAQRNVELMWLTGRLATWVIFTEDRTHPKRSGRRRALPLHKEGEQPSPHASRGSPSPPPAPLDHVDKTSVDRLSAEKRVAFGTQDQQRPARESCGDSTWGLD